MQKIRITRAEYDDALKKLVYLGKHEREDYEAEEVDRLALILKTAYEDALKGGGEDV